jgi:hypothetical protein
MLLCVGACGAMNMISTQLINMWNRDQGVFFPHFECLQYSVHTGYVLALQVDMHHHAVAAAVLHR